MAGRGSSFAAGEPPDIEGALAALDAPALRELVRDLLQSLEPEAGVQVLRGLVERAARSGAGWRPPPLSERVVEEALAFVEAAVHVGWAHPLEVDAYLARARDAFLVRDYDTTARMLRALLTPLGDGEIDLGQDELIEEVLTEDLDASAARLVVATYMTATPEDRPSLVREALKLVSSFSEVRTPLAQMDQVAVESLPDMGAFLPAWRALLEAEDDSRSLPWTGPPVWLREVAERIDGAEGLAALARTSSHPADLRAWCECLVQQGAWEAALAAYGEAAERVAGSDSVRAEFLDGAARAAQALGRRDLPQRLERAWRAEPSLKRLLRWLATAGARGPLRERSRSALEACSTKLGRQRAVLHVLAGEPSAAAKLLADAPGLGWSSPEHPGHLLVPLFRTLLGEPDASWVRRDLSLPGRMTPESFAMVPREQQREVGELLERAGRASITEPIERATLLGALRRAAERRLAGVTEHKRRRHYDHAAEVVAVAIACDASTEAKAWLARIRSTYSRYPALQAALDRQLGSA